VRGWDSYDALVLQICSSLLIAVMHILSKLVMEKVQSASSAVSRLLLFLSQARLETRAMERTVLPRASESHVSTPLINVGHNDGMRTDGRN
jgi:hypothetical protein